MSVLDRLFGRKNNAENEQAEQDEQRQAEAVAELANPLEHNAAVDKLRHPEDEAFIESALQSLRAVVERHIARRTLDAEKPRPIDAATRVFMSEDRMTACVCVLPPFDGGQEVSLQMLREDLRYEGITYGVLDDALEELVEQQLYLHIFPIARGTAPVDGIDGTVQPLIEQRDAIRIDATPDEVLDFNMSELVQAIHKGDRICKITPAVPGKVGSDVTGRLINGHIGQEPVIPRGRNTEPSGDGKFLLATITGAVFVEDGLFCVEQRRIISGDLRSDSGNLDYPGDIWVKGSVTGGLTINAAGDVIIEGAVDQAQIIAKGTIRVQKGMKGPGLLRAGRQVQCAVIENAIIDAGDSVYAEVIINSKITCENTVYATQGRGLIVGGHVRAREGICALKIGNQSECLNRLTLGRYAEVQRQIETTAAELEEAHLTLERLRQNVLNMRAVTNLSLEKRALLQQLTEQKALYTTREEELNERITQLRQQSHADMTGHIRCDELYPQTEITIGDQSVSVQQPVTDCNIHLYNGNLIMH